MGLYHWSGLETFWWFFFQNLVSLILGATGCQNACPRWLSRLFYAMNLLLGLLFVSRFIFNWLKLPCEISFSNSVDTYNGSWIFALIDAFSIFFVLGERLYLIDQHKPLFHPWHGKTKLNHYRVVLQLWPLTFSGFNCFYFVNRSFHHTEQVFPMYFLMVIAQILLWDLLFYLN